MMDRSRGIGGSDIAALLGISPWKSSLGVYLDKIGESVQEDKPHLKKGREAQKAVLRCYEDYAETLIEKEDIEIIHPEYSFLIGNVDAVTNRGKTFVEAKTTSRGIKDWDFQIPPYYRTQVAFYAALGNPDYVDMPVAYWFKYSEDRPEVEHFASLTYWRDEPFEKMVIDCAVDFWESHVLKRVPPEPRTLEDIRKRYAVSVDTKILATDEIKKNIQQLAELKKRREEIERQEDELRLNIQMFIGENSLVVDEEGRPLASFRSQNKSSVDSTRLKKEHPALMEQYQKNSTVRVFKLLGKEVNHAAPTSIQ